MTIHLVTATNEEEDKMVELINIAANETYPIFIDKINFLLAELGRMNLKTPGKNKSVIFSYITTSMIKLCLSMSSNVSVPPQAVLKDMCDSMMIAFSEAIRHFEKEKMN